MGALAGDLARETGARCKLSGLFTQAGPTHAPGRGASMGRARDVSALLDPLPEADREAVLGRNALRTCRLASAHYDRASLLNRS